MNDPKIKLGQVQSYEYDASNFKAELKAKLMQEYRARYGIEEDYAMEVPEKKSFFSFNRLVFTPIMAILVLGVFISYEYVNKPMTAYAYLKEVEKYNKDLKNGVKVNAIHTINGYELNVRVNRDKDGNLEVIVIQGDNEVENFVMHDGVLYVKKDYADANEVAPTPVGDSMLMLAPTIEQNSIAERADELNSIVSSLVLADLSDPQDEWQDIMNRDDVTFEEQEDGSVRIAYEENLDGKSFVNEFYFRDFKPLKKVKTQKAVNSMIATKRITPEVEVTEYRDIQPQVDSIETPNDFVVFVNNGEFNKEMSDLVDTKVNDLVREYTELPEKDPYFAVWNERSFTQPEERILSSAIDLPEASDGVMMIEDADVENDLNTITRTEALPTMAEPVPNLKKISITEEGLSDKSIATPKTREFVTPDSTAGFVQQQKPVMRDTYLDGVYKLLDDDFPTDKVEKDIDNNAKDEMKKEVLPVISVPVGGVTVERRPIGKPDVKIDSPTIGDDKKFDLIEKKDPNASVKDITPVPEPVMAEPMDKVFDVKNDAPVGGGSTNTESSTDASVYRGAVNGTSAGSAGIDEAGDATGSAGTSYIDLLRNRESLQDDTALQRLQFRMQQETEQLNPTERIVEPTEPVSEFKKQ